MKEKLEALWYKLIKNSKFIFPLIVGIAVGITVTVALSAFGAKADKVEQFEGSVSAEEEELSQPPEVLVLEDIPLTANEDVKIQQLITKYFNALAEGDKDTLKALCDFIADDKLLEISELAKFVDAYDELEIYTKPGYSEGAYVTYVCYKMLFSGKESGYPGYRTLYVSQNEKGENYLKFDLSNEENEYIIRVSSQADVVDMNNRVAVEYNDLMSAQPELLRYLSEVQNEVQIAMGVIYGQEATGGNSGSGQDGNGEEDEGDTEAGGNTGVNETISTEGAVVYARTNTAVNVRSSDSLQADKLGKAMEGTKVQVLEQRVNGWTKVKFENKEGFIKSEFLDVQESAAGAEIIGSITAKTNVNVRAKASETADILGQLPGGSAADLVAKENGWCKIVYGGQIGYVKGEYVE